MINDQISQFPSPPADTPPPTKSKKQLYIALVAVVVLLLLGGSIYGYYSGAFLSMPRLAQEAIGNMLEIESASYDSTISIDFGEAAMALGTNPLAGIGDSSKMVLTVKGSYDTSDKENIRNETAIDVSIGNLNASGEIRMIGGVMYWKLTEVPSAGIIPIPMLGDVANKWIAVEYKGNPEALLNPLGALPSSGAKIEEKFTEEQKERIFELFRKARIIKVTKKHSPEEINSVLSYHFAFDLDREGIAAYLNTLKEYVNEEGKNDSALTVFDPTSFSKSLENIEDFHGELWIGKADRLPRKVLVSFNVDMAGGEEGVSPVRVVIVSIMSGWNEPVTVKTPADSVSLEELISSMFGGPLAEAQEKGKDAAIKSGLSLLRANGELYYDSNQSYKGFCTSKLATPELETVQTNSGTKPVCKDSANTWAAGAKLSSNYWCVDSTGVSKETKTLATTTTCPQ